MLAALLAIGAALAAGDSVRLVVVGDTGAAADGKSGNISAEGLADLKRTLLRLEPDAVLAPGDLVYGSGLLERSPKCEALGPEEKQLFDERIGARLGDLGAPVYLLPGNHDTGHVRRNTKRVGCLRLWVEATGAPFVLLDHTQAVAWGPASLVAVDTNRPLDRKGAREALAGQPADGWRIAAGHHPLRTIDDKERSKRVRKLLRPLPPEARPDLWINGHAHILQLTIDQGAPALTSGAGSKSRRVRDCGGQRPCDVRGQDWSLQRSHPGHGAALVELWSDAMQVSLYAAEGAELSCWERKRGDAAGAGACSE